MYHRMQARIAARGLMRPSGKRRGKALALMPMTSVRFLPQGFVTPSVINIYGGNVALYEMREGQPPSVILIQSTQLAKSFTEYFEWAWRQSFTPSAGTGTPAHRRT